MRWFGQVDGADEGWKLDVEKVVLPSQVGLGILRLRPSQYNCDPISEDEFMTKRNTARPLGILSFPRHPSRYSYRETTSAHSLYFSSNMLISYFPCAELPTDPAMRIADTLSLLTGERWKAEAAEHIKSYLSDIAVDTKDLDSSYSSMREP